ncbi:hypothetical protein yc1106_07010 [Curvularia clavata]|uniref:Diphthine--ammonia ligase n=1 Tax=Curvularia clavata TaxID=95742 RepID=A0A9Q8ZAT8_CURCL|nr:hypothetical protein yc1106_07010 [Curvularia clavata]
MAQSSSLNVIALISGGKDSLFSILHCQANGHRVVALANLHPRPLANGDEQDTNSYMYQTVGHSVIPLYEQALGLPLYRREITGTAVNSSRDYAAPSSQKQQQEQEQEQEQDETEDLVPLLTSIMRAHPEANAVSTGAILSTYQRTRVESVALRLGLTPLSYLWQYPLLPPYTQSSLLHDMCAVGQEAIIIKTASGGLDEGFLGLNVAHPVSITRLAKAMSRFGDAGDGAILGEGGEFETLALNGPRPLWKKKIQIDGGPSAVLEGGQTVLKVQASSLEEKTEEDEGSAGCLRVPELFDDEFAKLLDTTESGSDNQDEVDAEDGTAQDAVSLAERLPRNTCSDTDTVFTYSNMATPVPPPLSTPLSMPPCQQLHSLLVRLETDKHHYFSKTSINHCTLLLRDMADFALLNPIYARYFSHVNPPARVTIAVGDAMPTGIDVMLSVVLDKSANNTDRQGLHVQGRSYWAPANIGPYSQAISARLPCPTITGENSSTNVGAEVVYIAGQIPLVPASMEPYTSHGFKGQAILSLQHLWRIGRAKGVRWWTGAVAFIPSSTAIDSDIRHCVRTAQQAWREIHMAALPKESTEDSDDEGDDMDPWDKLNTASSFSSFKDVTFRAQIPDYSVLSETTDSEPKSMVPPCFVAQVASLPRGVDIEWSATGLAIPSSSSQNIQFTRHAQSPYLSTTTVHGTRSRFVALEVHGEERVEEKLGPWRTATAYVNCHLQSSSTHLEGILSNGGVQWVPCRRVWGQDGREVRAVVVGRIDE